jgi:hypothetical protein
MKSSASRIEPIHPDHAGIDPEIAEMVGQEILHGRLEPAAWATALAASGGRKQDALAAYARIRMQKVSTSRRLRRDKVKSFEARRLTTCLGIKTVQDLLRRSNRGGQLNLVKPKLSFVWLAILLVGSAGSIASLGRLLGDRLPGSIAGWLPAAALLFGIAVVGGVLALRAFLPRRWVMLGWNLGITTACTVACFGSLCLGAQLIAKTPPEILRRLGNAGPSPQPLAVESPAPAPSAPPSGERTPMVVKPRLAPPMTMAGERAE